jgi:hypothetical protein
MQRQAVTRCLAESQPAVVAVVDLGMLRVKQAQALQAAAPAHQVQTVIDIVCLVATEPLDKDSQAELVVDLIVKAIINMPAVVVVEQVARAKMPAITDMNILHQTAVLALHQTCWETYIILPVVEAVAHTICLQAAAQAE